MHLNTIFIVKTRSCQSCKWIFTKREFTAHHFVWGEILSFTKNQTPIFVDHGLWNHLVGQFVIIKQFCDFKKEKRNYLNNPSNKIKVFASAIERILTSKRLIAAAFTSIRSLMKSQKDNDTILVNKF